VSIERVEDLIAFQFAEEFKLAVYDLIERFPVVQRSFKYREQLDDSASGIERAVAEGFGRRNPAEFAQFLRYALGSLAEATTCLRDGVQRKFFTEADCDVALTWSRRCERALQNLHARQRRRAAEARARQKRRPRTAAPSTLPRGTR
jgi:four helix bundle protein